MTDQDSLPAEVHPVDCERGATTGSGTASHDAEAPGPDFDLAVEDLLQAVLVRPRREPRLAYALEGAESVRVASRWGELAAWRLGSGPALLLVHGFMDDNSLWQPLIVELIERGQSVIAFDLPGHGHSGGDWCLGWQVADAIEAVAGSMGPVRAVVAHSMGAVATIAALSEGLCVDTAALIAPPTMGYHEIWSIAGTRTGAPPEVSAAAEQRYNVAVGIERNGWSIEAALPTLHARLLFVHSRDDERFPFADTEHLAATSSDVNLFAVDHLSHRATARDPQVIARITEFVCRDPSIA